MGLLLLMKTMRVKKSFKYVTKSCLCQHISCSITCSIPVSPISNYKSSTLFRESGGLVCEVIVWKIAAVMAENRNLSGEMDLW